MKKLILLFTLLVSISVKAQLTSDDVLIPTNQYNFILDFYRNIDVDDIIFDIYEDKAFFSLPYSISHTQIRNDIRSYLFIFYTINKDWHVVDGLYYIRVYVGRETMLVCQSTEQRKILISTKYFLK